MPDSHAYTLINAFTTSPSSGNPAAVVLLPPAPSDTALPDGDLSALKALYPPLEDLVRAAKELDQPMTAFAIPLPSESNSDADRPTFALRWINPVTEVELCGHASMALSWHLLSENPSWEGVRYHTVAGVLRASRVPSEDGAGAGAGVQVGLDFPALTERQSVAVGSKRYEEVMRFAQVASVGFDPSQVLAVSDAPGRILVEVNSDFDLRGLDMDCVKLAPISPANLILTQVVPARSTAQGYEGEHIRSRVFNTIPKFEHEDSVTGSAHCLIAPYFLSDPAAQARLAPLLPPATDARAAETGEVRIVVHQVSPRGGRLVASWNKAEATVRLEGTGVRVGEGTVTV